MSQTPGNQKCKTKREQWESEVEYCLEADFEDIPVRGNALASGDDVEDRECEDALVERLERGDVWAWASVKVTAAWHGFEGYDYLGCCTYKDEAAFKQDGDWNDMKVAARWELERSIQAAREGAKGYVEI